MKRVMCGFLTLMLIFALLPVAASASEITEQVIPVDDDSYIVVTINTVDSRASGTKTGTKTYTYKSSGATVWQTTLTGTFSYTGTSATCTSSSCSVSVSDSAWYTISKSARKSGNSATATVTMGRKVSGVTVDQYTANLKLSCDANGNLS